MRRSAAIWPSSSAKTKPSAAPPWHLSILRLSTNPRKNWNRPLVDDEGPLQLLASGSARYPDRGYVRASSVGPEIVCPGSSVRTPANFGQGHRKQTILRKRHHRCQRFADWHGGDRRRLQESRHS